MPEASVGSEIDESFPHTCSVLAAASSTSAEDGRPSLSWSSGATTTTGIACRLSEVSMQTRAELASGAIQADHEMWLAWGEAPSSLRAATAERLHRIINVLRRSDNTSVDAGPFDVRHAANVGGADEILKLYLMRVA